MLPEPNVDPLSRRTPDPEIVLLVWDNAMNPFGRKPLSTSASHSYPSVLLGIVAVAPAASVATLVFLQNRILPSAAGIVIAASNPELTMNNWPVTAFSGRPPSAGGLKRGSRQVPVHVGGSCGSITAFAC